jgi:hypothetical protein
VIACWTYVQMAMRSNPGWGGNFFIVSFIHCVVLHCTKNYWNKSCIFFKGLLSFNISWPDIKWYCCSHLTNLCVYHVVIADCRTLKRYKIGVACNGRMSIPDLIKNHPGVELQHVDRQTHTHNQPYMHLFHAHCEKNA